MWKIVVTTFAAVFLAELGDKTQIAILSLTDRFNAPIAVLIGAGGALLFSTALAVGAGWLLARTVPHVWFRFVHYAAGALFIGIGIWTIVRA